jgi:hypothetical protein
MYITITMTAIAIIIPVTVIPVDDDEFIYGKKRNGPFTFIGNVKVMFWPE